MRQSTINHQRATQAGITLPMVLLFLLIITIAASFGIRRATLSEGLTRNQLDYEVSRQAAEAALRDAERDLRLVFASGGKPTGALCSRDDDRPIKGRTGLPNFDTDCPRGQCRFALAYYQASNWAASPASNPQPWWPTTGSKGGQWGNNKAIASGDCTTFKGAVPLGTFTGSPKVQGVARQPEYIMEFMQRGTDAVVRITARGFGVDEATETVMQSYFKPYIN